MQSERMMKKQLLIVLVLLLVISAAYASLNGASEVAGEPATASKQAQPNHEPAGKFVPTEKLRAGDAVAFPIDI